MLFTSTTTLVSVLASCVMLSGVVNAAGPRPQCTKKYHLSSNDTSCTTIAQQAGTNVSALQDMNPGLNCTNDILTFNSNGTRNPHGTNGTSGGSGGTYQGSNGTHPGSNGTHHGPNGTHVNGTNGNFNGTHPGFNSTDGTNGTHTKGPSLCIQQSTPACAQTDNATSTTCDELTSKWNITAKLFVQFNDDVSPKCNNLTAGQPYCVAIAGCRPSNSTNSTGARCQY